MKHETDVIAPVLQVLCEAPEGTLSTSALREQVKARIELTSDDLLPLSGRPDFRIDQIIRNLKSHRNSPGNPFAEGLVRDVHRGFQITKAGRRAATLSS